MKSAKRFAIIVGAVAGILLIACIVLCALFGRLLELLYISLIILAVLMVVATIFQVYSIAKLIRTITVVRNEMQPLLNSVQETVGIVKDTAKVAGNTASTIGTATKFTSEFALGPSVRTVAAVVGAQETLRVFLGKGHVRTRAEERRRQQREAMEAVVAEGGD
jgi:hypothetical protein